jgi:hypothetical protein
MRRYHARKRYILFVAAAYSFAISISAQDFADVASVLSVESHSSQP